MFPAKNVLHRFGHGSTSTMTSDSAWDSDPEDTTDLEELEEYRKLLEPRIEKLFPSKEDESSVESQFLARKLWNEPRKKMITLIDVERLPVEQTSRNKRPGLSTWHETLFREMHRLEVETNQLLRMEQKFREAYRQKSIIKTRPAKPKSDHQSPPLTEDMLDTVIQALNKGPNDIVGTVEKQTVSRADLDTLRALNWLNDTIINAYMNLISKRCQENTNLPKTYALNSFFLTRYMEAGYASVRRWTRRNDLFSYDIILIPVHLGAHWCMAVLDLRHKEIKFMDSMGSRKDEILRGLLDYLVEEMKDKKKQTLDATEWKLTNVQKLPQQLNGSDCGVFASKYADYASIDRPIGFSQADMPYFRRRMMVEIVMGRLMAVPNDSH